MGCITHDLQRDRRVCEGDETPAAGVISDWMLQASAGSAPRDPCHTNLLTNMLNYAVIFLIVAILAGVLGFGVIAGTAATIAKICFVVFLVLCLFSLLGGRTRS